MKKDDIVALFVEYGGKEGKGGVDVKVQYNKKDITAIFRKSACEKLKVEKIPSFHYSDVKSLEKALEKVKEKTGVELVVG